jgi:hypothetical protein
MSSSPDYPIVAEEGMTVEDSILGQTFTPMDFTKGITSSGPKQNSLLAAIP